MAGKLIIFCGPSGSGKTTLVRHVLKGVSRLAFSVSACSRQKRPAENEGRDYYFLTAEEFRNKITANEFIEWEEVYPGHLYGTLGSEVDRLWSQGYDVIFDVDVVGGLNIKSQYGNRALAIFIMPPSVEELEKRLIKRSTENRYNLIKRISKAKREIGYSDKFDLIIVNEDLNKARNQSIKAVENFLDNTL